MPTLAEIRAKLAAAKKQSESNGSGGDKSVFPFWDIPENKTAVVRFLPDGSPDAEYFWQERMVIRLPFQGVLGGDENKEVTVTVPCLRMWKGADGKPLADPILAATKDWWDGDDELKELARKYWIKRSFVFQGFVVDNPLEEKEAPENPIRRFIINPSIFNLIKDSLMNPDMEELPTDYTRGRDFKITKTRRGEYADYTTSTWSFKERSLAQAELEAIEKHGLFNLKDFLPQKPTDAQQKMIFEMFEASIAGQPYDLKKWGEHYRPNGLRGDSAATGTEDGGEKTTTTVAVSKPVVTEETSVAASVNPLEALKARAAATAAASGEEATTAEKPKADAQAILDLIKARSAS